MKNNVKKYTIYFGTELDKEGYPVSWGALDSCLRHIDAVVLSMLGGVTLTQCDGVYRYDNGRVISERSYRLEYIDFSGNNGNAIRSLAIDIRALLSQESVLFTVEDVDAEFI